MQSSRVIAELRGSEVRCYTGSEIVVEVKCITQIGSMHSIQLKSN